MFTHLSSNRYAGISSPLPWLNWEPCTSLPINDPKCCYKALALGYSYNKQSKCERRGGFICNTFLLSCDTRAWMWWSKLFDLDVRGASKTWDLMQQLESLRSKQSIACTDMHTHRSMRSLYLHVNGRQAQVRLLNAVHNVLKWAEPPAGHITINPFKCIST